MTVLGKTHSLPPGDQRAPAIDAPAARTPAAPISIVLIEENGLFGEGLQTLLALEPDLRILADGREVSEAEEIVRTNRPHIVLLGFDLDPSNGPAVTAAILAASPTSRVVLLHLRAGQLDLAAHVSAGASGLVLRDATMEELRSTIRTVASGVDVLPAALLTTLFAQMSHEKDRLSPASTSGRPPLTPREREVMDQILEGRSNKDIAKRLGIAVDTVKSHVHRLLQKLAVHSRVELVASARLTESASRHYAPGLASRH